MAPDRRTADDLSIAELEMLLTRKRIAARQIRHEQFRRTGRIVRPELIEPVKEQMRPNRRVSEPFVEESATRRMLNRVLLGVEVLAVIGFLFIVLRGAGALQELNAEVSQALAGPLTPTPLLRAVVLPSGHTPPTSPGGARPNEAEIPESLRPIVQSMPVPVVPTSSPQQARNIFIPAIWNDAAPVVQGDGWEQLKKGVGQFIGSANPGQAGNLVLSAHNDIFGELFRDLDKLQPGDEVIVSTASQEYTYRITGWRIVEPTEVSVLEPTPKPTITLISCYPYLVDTERIVVFGELVEG